jgi:hypothetical protein
MKKIFIFSSVTAALAAFFASSFPDGLEKVAEMLGFIEKASGHQSVMTDYVMPGLPEGGISVTAAGITGLLIIYGIFYLITVAFRGLSGKAVK